MKLRLVLACSSAVASLGLCATAAPVLAAPAHAVPLNVTVGCSNTAALITAVQQVNANPDGGTIHLAERCTYPFLDDFANSGNALPVITGKVTIKGEDSTLIRSASAPFRLIEVAASGQLTLKGLTVAGGNVAVIGGGILNRGTLQVEKSTVAGNQAEQAGGGIANVNGRVTLVRSHVRTNTVTNQNSAEAVGGGISNSAGGTVELVRTTVSGNTADQAGGGIVNVGTLNVKDSRIEHNAVTNQQGGGGTQGGGIYTLGTAVIKDTKIVENWAGDDGGGIKNATPGTLEIHGGEIGDNKAGQDGGGLDNSGRATLSKTKVLKNQAGDDGGGINNERAFNGAPAPVLTVKRAVIKENRAGGEGGGINNVAPGTVQNEHSEITRNKPTNCAGNVPDCSNH
ncbi:hypothetical protein [Streptomyces sp. NBC_00091]|uniref:hypothetical protein n=1 Tax=Streptomyces sp. NBC_00091 TaxID=2975648 RepID=UPI00225229A6|nr:hypothetical protein [Streptomyces sp. NBC_00091]MCX5378076.1 hypothetical protein [Streptomyces sp. NBC_00091]